MSHQIQTLAPVRARTSSSNVVRCSVRDRVTAPYAVFTTFFYRRAIDESALVEGLSTALERVPIFAGRIRDEGEAFEIVCDNSGVPLSRANVDQTLEEAISAVSRGKAPWLFEPVDPGRAMQARAPLLTVRLSRLKDGGSVLGACWAHAIGDMSSFMVLMRAWSAAVEGTPMPEPPLVEDRDAYLMAHIPDEGSDRPWVRMFGFGEMARFVASAVWDNVQKTRVQVHFSDAEIQKMRELFGAAIGARLSANDVLCAHIMDVIAEYDGLDRKLAFAVDFRRRVGLDSMLLGNLLTTVALGHTPSEHPARMAGRIRAALTNFAKEHMDYHATQRFIASLGSRSRLKRCLPNAFGAGASPLVVTNWSNFGVYDISFGGQTPAHFIPGDMPFAWMSIIVEGRGNSGLEFSGFFPSALGARLNSEEGRARLSCFRSN